MWMTIPEVAAKIGRASSTVRRWARSGRLDVRTELRSGRDVRLVQLHAVCELAGIDAPSDTVGVPTAPPEARPDAAAAPAVETRLDAALAEVERLRVELAESSKVAAVAQARLEGAQVRIEDMARHVEQTERRLAEAVHERRAATGEMMRRADAHAALAAQVEGYRHLSAWGRLWTAPPEARILSGPTSDDEPLEGH